MSEEVKFEDEDFREYRGYRTPIETLGTLENLVVKVGLAKDAASASYVLIIVAILSFAITAFIFIRIMFSSLKPPVSNDVMIQALQKTENSYGL
ncbi:MAG: hypothetical protein HY507_01405 [Candidatus Zambryskibacteria bacterium]|nr:hypothetical protein [Candidatus Zambryskibacteria bacterium]